VTIIYDYITCNSASPGVSREFESAHAAMLHDDPNPMRQHLGMPLKHACEDCESEQELVPHGKSLICLACYAEREAFMQDEVYPDPHPDKIAREELRDWENGR
jgi:hypothetical protein